MIGNMTAPVNEGDELDVTIEAIGDKGDGIAKKEGFVLVIPGTKVDQRVRIRVTKVLRKVGFAEVIGDAQEAPQDEVSEEDIEEVSKEEVSEEELEDDEPEEPPKDSETFGEELEE